MSFIFTTLALLLNFLTLVLLFWQIKVQHKTMVKDHERRQKQATFEAMHQIRSNELDSFERKTRKMVYDHTDWSEVPETLRDDVRSILSHFERFAVAINTNVYSFEIVNRTMGAYLLGLWKDYDDYVIYVRKKVPDANKKYYYDLEKLVDRISKLRNPENNHNSGQMSD